KTKRKDIELPQTSGPTTNIADEAVNEDMNDSLVRAATTTSSLEVEQDSRNINKTQSKVTPNESSSQGTDSGGGPRTRLVKDRQEKDKIGLKPDKNGKRGEAGKSQKQLLKTKRKDIELPQTSGPTTNIADEAVNEDMNDSLVRAATTTSSLEVEQDSRNINKTQSKVTPNESSSQGTDSGGGPRTRLVKDRQEKDKIGSKWDKNGKRGEAGKRLKKTKKRTKSNQNQKKREAWRRREKFKAVAVERGRKTKENKKRMAENAYTYQKLCKFKERRKEKGQK
nr:hypothetical protein [Tanacetum cinerariifolium]